MNVTVIKTHAIGSGQSIFEILDRYITDLEENTVIAITSKIISISQGRAVKVTDRATKFDLIKQESEKMLSASENSTFGDFVLTIAQGRLIPSAGIDESNGNGLCILLPENPQGMAVEIWQYLRKIHKIKNLGVIITDSNITPLRRGVTGISLGWCGFEPLRAYVGDKDIFGKEMKFTYGNNLDALASSAVFMMGEGKEQTPIAMIKDALPIIFLDRPPTAVEETSVKISIEEDLYGALLRSLFKT